MGLFALCEYGIFLVILMHLPLFRLIKMRYLYSFAMHLLKNSVCLIKNSNFWNEYAIYFISKSEKMYISFVALPHLKYAFFPSLDKINGIFIPKVWISSIYCKYTFSFFQGLDPRSPCIRGIIRAHVGVWVFLYKWGSFSCSLSLHYIQQPTRCLHICLSLFAE